MTTATGLLATAFATARTADGRFGAQAEYEIVVPVGTCAALPTALKRRRADVEGQSACGSRPAIRPSFFTSALSPDHREPERAEIRLPVPARPRARVARVTKQSPRGCATRTFPSAVPPHEVIRSAAPRASVAGVMPNPAERPRRSGSAVTAS
jgi:hypothetical protein